MQAKSIFSRLLRLRELEEEQNRLELEAAVGMRDRVAQSLQTAADRVTYSRQLFAAGVGDLDSAARVGAAIQWDQARRQQGSIRPQLEAAEREVGRRREEFLIRRTARRQVETLLERELQARREREARGAQQRLDDWFSRQGRRSEASVDTVAGAEKPRADRAPDSGMPTASSRHSADSETAP